MNKNPVTFVAFRDFDNLGIGYISSVLETAGYSVSFIDFRDGNTEILKQIKQLEPRIIGFSIIFQYHIYEFQSLIEYLRENGINCHFTAGGQYASMRYEELFGIIPTLDTIVRFDGEYTFLDLVNCIYSGQDWKNITGIVFNVSGKIVVNPLRPVETDLGKFPIPKRSPLKEYALDKKFATIIAGRGCVNNCSFCYLREYSRLSSGPLKRLRKPENVVEEMELLHYEMNCSVFLFQDDDFPVKPTNELLWVKIFCDELRQKKLVNNIIWKMNCRPDEINYDTFSLMKEHGLFLVFLGIEDGTDTGLARLNKHMSVAENIEGINILKSLDIGFDFGFLLFQPTSSFSSIKENLDFLYSICADGFTPVTFLKLLPFCATPVEEELRREGRLTGKPGSLDYEFYDKSLNNYFDFITDAFFEWLRDSEGLLNLSKWTRNYIAVYIHFFKFPEAIQQMKNEFFTIVSECNIFLLDTMQELLIIFESGKYDLANVEFDQFRDKIKTTHDLYKKRLQKILTKLSVIVEI